MIIVERPQPFERKAYAEAVAHVSQHLSMDPGVQAILQFGNVNTPGISDIDLLVIGKDQQAVSCSGFEQLPSSFKGLFTHGILGISARHFHANRKLNSWSAHQLIWGEIPEDNAEMNLTEAEQQLLQRQAAIEFLLVNYLDLKMQQAYGIIKLRSFLQHIKGIRFDLEWLSVKEHWIYALVAQLQHWINEWEKEQPTDKQLKEFFGQFTKAYFPFVEEMLVTEPFQVPKTSVHRISSKNYLTPSNRLVVNRKGILLPSWPAYFGDKNYLKLQNKFNSFNLEVPLVACPQESILKKRFDLLSEIKTYNEKYLPKLSLLAGSLSAKLV